MYKYFQMYSLKYRQKVWIIYSLMALLCLGISGFLVYRAVGNPKLIQNWIILAFVLAAAGYMVYRIFTIEKLVNKSIAEFFSRNVPVEISLLVDEEGIGFLAPNGTDVTRKYYWKDATKVTTIPEYYFVSFGKHDIIIERDPNCFIEGNEAALEELFKQLPPKAKRKEITKDILRFHHQYEDRAVFEQALAERQGAANAVAAAEAVESAEVPAEAEAVEGEPAAAEQEQAPEEAADGKAKAEAKQDKATTKKTK